MGYKHTKDSMIKLVSPLTEETVSINNGGGGNWGVVDDDGEHYWEHYLIDTIAMTPKFDQVRVPEDYATLLEAVKHVEISCRLTTIVVGKGVHGVGEVVGDTCMVELFHLHISSSMNIIGDSNVPKEKIVFIGGIVVRKKSEYDRGEQAIVHVQHMTLRKSDFHTSGGGNWGVGRTRRGAHGFDFGVGDSVQRRLQLSFLKMEDVNMEEGWLV